LIHKLPDLLVRCVEDVRAVDMDIDTLSLLCVAVSAYVLALIKDKDALAIAMSFMSKNASK
jgi:hypothetical protein